MSVHSIAVCVHGTHVPMLDRIPENLKVFGHFVVNGNQSAQNPAALTNLKTSPPVSGPTREYKLRDVARVGERAAQWATLRHLNDAYALMMSVLHKKDHEISTNTRFDRVICVRTCPGMPPLDEMIAGHLGEYPGGTIRCKTLRDARDNNLWSVDLTVMSGASRDVDTLSRFYHSYSTGEFWDITHTTEIDPAYRQANLGSLLWKWMYLRNLHAIG